MKIHYVIIIILLIAGACSLGCTSTQNSAQNNASCPASSAKDLLPMNNMSDYRLTSVSDNLGSDFYRVLLQNDTLLLMEIKGGVLAEYNSTKILGSNMNILVIGFKDPSRAQTAALKMQSTIARPTSLGTTVKEESFMRNNITYNSIQISGITNANGVGFYQEFVFWQVQYYTIMAKLTTPDIGQDPHQDVLKFIDEMAYLCMP
jgi:hypothetical protein